MRFHPFLCTKLYDPGESRGNGRKKDARAPETKGDEWENSIHYANEFSIWLCANTLQFMCWPKSRSVRIFACMAVLLRHACNAVVFPCSLHFTAAAAFRFLPAIYLTELKVHRQIAIRMTVKIHFIFEFYSIFVKSFFYWKSFWFFH